MHQRQEAVIRNITSHDRLMESEAERRYREFQNPPLLFREFIAFRVSPWIEKEKRKFQVRGVPLHIRAVDFAARPFVAATNERRNKLSKLFSGTGMDEEGLKLYRTMSRWEIRTIEDAWPPCPTVVPLARTKD